MKTFTIPDLQKVYRNLKVTFSELAESETRIIGEILKDKDLKKMDRADLIKLKENMLIANLKLGEEAQYALAILSTSLEKSLAIGITEDNDSFVNRQREKLVENFTNLFTLYSGIGNKFLTTRIEINKQIEQSRLQIIK